MAFKPNRERLNSNFEGYKLSPNPLVCLSQPLPCGVKVASLKEEQFSFQHVRSFSLHNHLVLDPWDQTSAYWYAEDRTVQRAKFEASAGKLTVSSIYRCEPHPSKPSSDYVVNASIVFLTDTLCLFSDGDGSLQLLWTDKRDPSVGSSSPTWKLLENIALTGLEGAPYMVLAARADGQDLDTATLELKDPSSFKHPANSTQPTIAVYRWHKLHFSTSLSAFTPQCGEDGSTIGNFLEESKLHCTLHSRAISLYCDFLDPVLLIVSEASLVHHSDDPNQDPSAEELVSPVDEEIGELDEADKPHLGLGYTQVEVEQAYKWRQSDSDVTITVRLPPEVTKRDIDCVIERDEVVVGLTDGTTYVRGKLHAAVDPEASAWTVEKERLEVTLEKKDQGNTWPSLLEGEEGDGGAPSLPLREGLTTDRLTKEKLEEMERKIAEASGKDHDEEEAPRSKKPRPMVENTLEECDATEEDATLFVVREDGTVTQKAGLGGRHILFTAPGPPASPDLLCLRHDVDAVIWQPSAPPTDNPGAIKWLHRETFNALGYVQSAKENKKFTTCPSNFRFAAIGDCNRHVFVYQQPPEGVKGNNAVQYVHTILSGAGILGLRASTTGLVFVLCENEVLVLLAKDT